MEEVDWIGAHDKEAARYDQQVKEYESYAHDVLFGMSFEYVHPDEYLLDVGIGTGLASLPFARAGLEVFGCDGSAGMLKVCESKAFARELKVLDLKDIPWPYPDGFFHHVISCGVFHFFGELRPMIREISRIIKPAGIFAFTVAAQTSAEEQAAGQNPRGYSETPTAWGVNIFKHGAGYVTDLLRAYGFDMLKTQKLLMRSSPDVRDADMLFAVHIARQASALSP